MQPNVEKGWPSIVFDALEALHALDPAARHRRDPRMFPLLTMPRATVVKPADVSPLVENEPGLCERMEAIQASLRHHPCLCAHWRARDEGAYEATMLPAVPLLAELVRRQHDGYVGFGVREILIDAPEFTLAPPVLFCALVRNLRPEQIWIVAVGSRWLLPPLSAFALMPLRRWHELGRLPTVANGYRCLLMDPPWHSASVARKGNYSTLDKRELLAELVPVILRLGCRRGCALAVWVTNSRHVQDFVETQLFPLCGARPIGRWYWLKVTPSGDWATGAHPRSPHRKPWEVLLLGWICDDPQGTPPPLPEPRTSLCQRGRS